jgi:hypothetical protein
MRRDLSGLITCHINPSRSRSPNGHRLGAVFDVFMKMGEILKVDGVVGTGELNYFWMRKKKREPRGMVSRYKTERNTRRAGMTKKEGEESNHHP